MNLNQVTLPATDVTRSVEFYRTMGFRQIVANLPDYARFECPGGGSTFSVHRVDSLPKSNGVIVYFECDDLDGTVRRLKDAGIDIDREPADQSWLWREAYLHDPDGNTICLYHAGSNRRFPPWRLRDETTPLPGGFTISIEDEPDGNDVQVLAAGLTAHAIPIVGRPGFKTVAVFARDPQGKVVGGIAAMINWQWLSVNLVWVDESLRGTGLGHRMLEEIEALGCRHGCTHAHLDTFSYQARPFYERHGYALFATLEDYPSGHRRFYMSKTLG